MAQKPKAKPQRKPGKIKEQTERFKQAAREHQADETGTMFSLFVSKILSPPGKKSLRKADHR
jgi:hypothetical protein